MDDSEVVVRNYAADGLAALVLEEASKLTGDAPMTVEHLGVFDEFHMGGRFATAEVVAALEVGATDRVLDVGSGIGGPARQVAYRTGAQVFGVDLTPAHVEAATLLSQHVGLTDQTTFELGNATRLPFEAGTFDAAMMLFVGMNVPDKAALFAEVHRVLRPGGRFAVYDPMRSGEAHPAYPVPWSADRAGSHIATVGDYRQQLSAAGFDLESDDDLLPAVQALAAQVEGGEPAGRAQMAARQFGADGPRRFENIGRAITDGVVEARLMVARSR